MRRESSDCLWLYVVDEAGDTVQAIDVQNREVTTLAGLYAADGYRDGRGTLAWFRNPYSITVDRSRTVPILYVAEIGTDESFSLTIDLLDNSVHTVAGIRTRRSAVTVLATGRASAAPRALRSTLSTRASSLCAITRTAPCEPSRRRLLPYADPDDRDPDTHRRAFGYAPSGQPALARLCSQTSRL